jgi:FkbM family methyltransferase
VFVEGVYQRHGITVADGDVVFDIGANIGMYMLLLNQLVANATVFCFEPIPDIFETLRRNSERHNQLQLHLMNCGLSREPGDATFTYYPNSAASSTMYPEMSAGERANFNQAVFDVLDGSANVTLNKPLRTILAFTPRPIKRLIADITRRCLLRGKLVNCPLRTISDVVDEHRLERIDLLKIDTESAEFDIVAGVRAEHWPRIRQAVMEVHNGEAQAKKMADFLAAHGFSIHSEPETADAAGNWSLYACREPS